jgi:aspartyl-tRNA synthetase
MKSWFVAKINFENRKQLSGKLNLLSNRLAFIEKKKKSHFNKILNSLRCFVPEDKLYESEKQRRFFFSFIMDCPI